MFVLSKVIEALERKAERFALFQGTSEKDIDCYWQQLIGATRLSVPELEQRLAGCPAPGALPTVEQGCGTDPIIRFEPRWQNHEQARAWALEILRGRPTFAVDGSQIMPQRAYSIPVALIQVGWFENLHTPDGLYDKDIEVEALAPDEVTYVDATDIPIESEINISLARFRREATRLANYAQSHAGQPSRPTAFFDGSLIVSFAARLPEEVRSPYIQAALSIVKASESAGVPVIGYVDTSYARDLVDMLRQAADLPQTRLSDATLLGSHMRWGDRSLAYVCARRDEILSGYRDAEPGGDWSRRIGFVYLKTTADGPPARIEFPLWILETARLEDTLNIVRAEAIVGNGYPYPLETADAVAVLTAEDNERFYRAFQQFAQRQGLLLRYSRKALSKRRRRT